MYKYNIKENNSLEKEIKKILSLCEKYDEENDGEYSYFNPSVSEEEMLRWEQENNTHIPESYKEWLRFTGKCRIAQNTAMFWGPSEFNSDYVEDDMVVIGELIGDGERVCFSKTTGVFYEIFEGETKKIESFVNVLNRIKSILDYKPILTKSRTEEILARIKEKREKGLI